MNKFLDWNKSCKLRCIHLDMNVYREIINFSESTNGLQIHVMQSKYENKIPSRTLRVSHCRIKRNF